ncbi:MAG: hypothetical protein IKP32_04090 [Clostridia bacterium]|nr:hypothetical protein [Clostridia bacterium]
MRRKAKRLGAWICAWTVFLSGFVSARAEFSPGWDALSAADAVTLEMDGHMDALDGLADSSLDAVNSFLSRMHAEMTLNEGDGGYHLQVCVDGQPAFAVSSGTGPEGVITAFFPSGGVYRTEKDAPDALALLTGVESADIRPLRLAEAYRQAAPALFAALAEYAEARPMKEKTSIKYAVSPPMYELYTFKDGALNEAWPHVAAQLIAALPSVLENRAEDQARAEELLRSLTFSGDCRVRRYLDADGQDMGLQFNGRAGPEGDMRKASLVLGFTPNTGGSLELSLPAVTGKNNLKITLAGRVTEKNGERTLTLSASRVRKTRDSHESASLDMTLKNAMQDGREHWSGKGTLTLDAGTKKMVWTWTPTLIYADDALSGDVAIQRKEGGKITLRGTVRVRLAKADPVAVPHAEGDKVDLRGKDPERARAAVMAEWPVLAGLAARLMATLPPDLRTRLTHDLRTDSWMTGPSVAPLEEDPFQEDSWVVEEEE